MNTEIDEPIDVIRLSLGKNVLVKCRNDRELRGKLHVCKFYILLIKLYF
jgi:small nuclear ribonucleoprotein (snRNP)-like protein